jgi:hypothetical protein
VAERLRFYLDEHVHPAVAAGLRRRDVDVITTREAGLLSADDEAQLAYAFGEARVVFTQDEDFLRLHTGGVVHCGIAYAPQHTPVGHIVRGLMLLYEVLNLNDMRNRVEFL